jgi:hypothetical protein
LVGFALLDLQKDGCSFHSHLSFVGAEYHEVVERWSSLLEVVVGRVGGVLDLNIGGCTKCVAPPGGQGSQGR